MTSRCVNLNRKKNVLCERFYKYYWKKVSLSWLLLHVKREIFFFLTTAGHKRPVPNLSAASFKKRILDRPWYYILLSAVYAGHPCPPYESDDVHLCSVLCFRGNKRILLWRFIGIGKIYQCNIGSFRSVRPLRRYGIAWEGNVKKPELFIMFRDLLVLRYMCMYVEGSLGLHLVSLDKECHQNEWMKSILRNCRETLIRALGQTELARRSRGWGV